MDFASFYLRRPVKFWNGRGTLLAHFRKSVIVEKSLATLVPVSVHLAYATLCAPTLLILRCTTLPLDVTLNVAPGLRWSLVICIGVKKRGDAVSPLCQLATN